MLTPEQETTLKAAIEADPIALAMWQAGRPWDVSTYLNVPADPEWTVWMTGVTKEEIYANGFNWVEVDNVTEPKWRVWNEIFWSGAMNPSKANVRAAIAEVWKGTATKLAVQQYVLDKCKRPALLGEKILSTGAGTPASPATMSFEGALSPQDVADAMQEG